MLSLHSKRLFTDKQREHIKDRANGKCENCGCELGDHWEADHKERFADGGETSVANAQALCIECHKQKTKLENYLDHAFRKTLTGKLPRQWQQDALKRVEELRTGPSGLNHFCISACPGAGKSLFMELVARHFLHIGLIDTILCIVPTDNLRTDAARNFKQDIGINLVAQAGDLKVKSASGCIGQVVTYSQLSNEENLDVSIDYWTRDGKKLLVIADEIHHAADHADSSWGKALSYALDRADFGLLLTGTLWRTDKTKIPGITYLQGVDQELVAKPHFELTLKEANEAGYVTTVWFDRFNINCKFVAKEAEQKLFPGVEDEEDIIDVCIREVEGKAGDVVLRNIVKNPYLDGVRHLLQMGENSLKTLKAAHWKNYDRNDENSPPAPAGLIIAADQRRANEIYNEIYKMTNKRPLLVHTGVRNDCKKLIDKFRTSDQDWIISVGMISEGVDIPRVKVICYLTNKKTRLIFAQIVGRAMRKRFDSSGRAIEEHAKILMPAHADLDLYSEDFLEEQDYVAQDDAAFGKTEDLENMTDKQKLDKSKHDAEILERELAQAEGRVFATAHIGTDTILNGETVSQWDFYQIGKELGIADDLLVKFHTKASLAGALK